MRFHFGGARTTVSLLFTPTKARENEMLENINSYVENNEFENAVFLCGSAHRKGIFNKIKVKKNIQLKWNFELPK